MYKNLTAEQVVLFNNFTIAATGDASRLADALCVVPRITLYAIARSKTIANNATELARVHPASTFIRHVAFCHQTQAATISVLFDELTRRINGVVTSTPADKKTRCAIAMSGSGRRMEAIGRVYCPIAWLPPGHDLGAGGGVASTALQQGSFGLGTFWIDDATPGSRRAFAVAAWLARVR